MTQPRTYERTIDCPVCGGSSTEFLFSKQGATFVRCPEDRLVFINPQPKTSALQEVYDQYGEEYMIHPDKIAVAESYPAERKEFLRYRQTNRILELGAASGAFLNLLRTDGWVTNGVELSGPSSNYARTTYGLDVHTGTIHNAGFPSDTFDVVVAWATIEHTPNPGEIFAEIRRILRPGGLFMMSVPHWKGITIRCIGPRYRYVCDDHLFYFSASNLHRLLMKMGFSRVETSTRGFDVIELFQDWRGDNEQRFRLAKAEGEKTLAGSILRTREKAVTFARSPILFPLRMGFRLLTSLLDAAGLGDALYAKAVK